MKSSTLDLQKPTKKEIIAYLRRKFMNTCSELKPRNIQYELEDGYEFCYTLNPQGRKSITIKKIDNAL